MAFAEAATGACKNTCEGQDSPHPDRRTATHTQRIVVAASRIVSWFVVEAAVGWWGFSFFYIKKVLLRLGFAKRVDLGICV